MQGSLASTQVANGPVKPGDWVRERPASHHFQPCYCCLCKPRTGELPIYQVESIVALQGRPYLRLVDDDEYPADEFEVVPAPEWAPLVSSVGANGVDLRGLPGRDSLRRMLSSLPS